MDLYPYKFKPLYKEKIWGGRNLERLFGRDLPAGRKIGESWELADLAEGTSVVSNGPLAGVSLTELTNRVGPDLLGSARPLGNGRFPLLLKLLDANDILSLQVHPDATAAEKIGNEATLKTECWYTLDSRSGFIYKGLKPGVTHSEFRKAVETNAVGDLVRRIDLVAGDFHYLPAGTVHALGPGLVVAEVQTPSDTTYRVTDWGRGREIHVDLSMRCIHFEPADDRAPGAEGETLLVTEFFTVARRAIGPHQEFTTPAGRCVALMLLDAGTNVRVRHGGSVERITRLVAGDTVLLPAGLRGTAMEAEKGCRFLEITLPES